MWNRFVLHVVRGVRMLPSFDIAKLGRSRRHAYTGAAESTHWRALLFFWL